MKRETKEERRAKHTPQFPTCHRVFHHCLPIAASRARLRALLCYVFLMDNKSLFLPLKFGRTVWDNGTEYQSKE